MVRFQSVSVEESSSSGPVSLVTQVRVLPSHGGEFERWQRRVNTRLEAFPGYVDYDFIAPAPPVQDDWVIVQRFVDGDAARAWLQCDDRKELLAEVQEMLVGPVDVHLFAEAASRRHSPVTVTITTRVPSGQEDEFLDWHRRIVAAQAAFPGFEGYRLERPIPGVQDEWVAGLRFDSYEHLQGWLESDERQTLLREDPTFGRGVGIRVVQNAFDSWFPSYTNREGAALPPPAWKQNMLVLLVLYPVVFVFSESVHDPLLVENGIPFWLALFIGNAVSVALLGWVFVPWVSKRFRWWLVASKGDHVRTDWLGTAIVTLLYGVSLATFSVYP